MMDDGHPLADERGLGEDVRAQQHGVIAAEVTDHLTRLLDLGGIQPRRRLVEEQDLRRAEQGLREPQPLPVSFRELADLLPHDRFQVTGRRHALHLAGEGGATHALDLGDESQVRAHVERVVQWRALGHVADATGGLDVLGGHIVPGHRHSPGGGRGEAGDQSHGRRLASTVGTEEADDLAAIHGEGHVADDGVRAVPLGDGLEDDGR